MSAVVYNSDGKQKTVKNLGWFFRKARKTVINKFTMSQASNSDGWNMTVEFVDGFVFKSDYASLEVFQTVMTRAHSLKGVVVEVIPAKTPPYSLKL